MRCRNPWHSRVTQDSNRRSRSSGRKEVTTNMHKLNHAHFDHGMLAKFIELLRLERTSPHVFLAFETLALLLNMDNDQDSRSRHTFEKSFLEQQHASSNLKWAVCVVFLKQRISQLLGQTLDILPSINRRNVKLYNISVLCHLIQWVKF